MAFIKSEVEVEVIIPNFCKRCPLYSIEHFGTTELYANNECYAQAEHYRCSHYSDCRAILDYLKMDEAAMINLQKEVYKGII